MARIFDENATREAPIDIADTLNSAASAQGNARQQWISIISR
jgi:hypothetical protein